MQRIREQSVDGTGRMLVVTDDGVAVYPDQRQLGEGRRYGVVVGHALVKQFVDPTTAENCARVLSGRAIDLLASPGGNGVALTEGVAPPTSAKAREAIDRETAASAPQNERSDARPRPSRDILGTNNPPADDPARSLRLVTGDDESAPAAVDEHGRVSTQFKTGDYLINAVTGGETVVEGLLHVGDVYLLGSDDKVGKTRTSHVAAYGVAAGRGFLDWPVPVPRDVLFVEQDESQEDTGNTLADALELGLVSEEDVRSGRVSYYNDFDAGGRHTAHRYFAFDDRTEGRTRIPGTRILLDQGLGKVLSDWRHTHRSGRLVIVDCLADVIDERHGFGQSVREDKATMSAFSTLAHDLGIALVIIHHTTKWQAEGSVADRLHGTRGVTAGATGTMLFQPEYERGAWTGKGTLTVKGRCQPRSVPISSERGFWKSMAGDAPEAYAPDDVVRMAYSWMMGRGESWRGKANELVAAANLPCNYRQVTKRLRVGREWLARNGVEYSLGLLNSGYRIITLKLNDEGLAASRAKGDSFRGAETIARPVFGEGVLCTYEAVGTMG